MVKADRALTNQSDFNGELASAILCVVEEKSITRAPGAQAKIKDAVTSPVLSIRQMRRDSYQIPNMTHWIQTSNNQSDCPTFPNDTRITSIYVSPLPVNEDGKTSEIPKRDLMRRLEAESPYFIRTLLDLPLPTPSGRLRIPIVTTPHKMTGIEKLSEAEQFLVRFVHACCVFDGRVSIAEFYDQYAARCKQSTQEPMEQKNVTKSLKNVFGDKIKYGNNVKISVGEKRQKAYGGLRMKTYEEISQDARRNDLEAA